ncbi:uncharacterized protein LOC135129938 [Zophobas morio]|uniref:uncharacterized protein LOC135129938 n=1 Tax=Zophobas morio TaxID=2755281 RepID=UPI0030832F20
MIKKHIEMLEYIDYLENMKDVNMRPVVVSNRKTGFVGLIVSLTSVSNLQEDLIACLVTASSLSIDGAPPHFERQVRQYLNEVPDDFENVVEEVHLSDVDSVFEQTASEQGEDEDDDDDDDDDELDDIQTMSPSGQGTCPARDMCGSIPHRSSKHFFFAYLHW